MWCSAHCYRHLPPKLSANGYQHQGDDRRTDQVLQGNEENWREDWLYEYYEYPWWHRVKPFRGVRTDRYKYIHWVRHPDLDELYDLESDPYEVENRVGDPALAEVRTELRAELGEHVLGALGLGN